MHRKAFTVGEANLLVPRLEAILDEITARMKVVERTIEKLHVLDVLWGDRLLDPSNPDHDEAEGLRLSVATAAGEVERIVEGEIVARGLRFPTGGLEHGLIDFPTTWEGRWVYLCWRKGEPDVSSWHELTTGFAGRQDVSVDHARGMGIEPARPDSPLP